jgi:hypothetical protein
MHHLKERISKPCLFRWSTALDECCFKESRTLLKLRFDENDGEDKTQLKFARSGHERSVRTAQVANPACSCPSGTALNACSSSVTYIASDTFVKNKTGYFHTGFTSELYVVKPSWLR